MRTMGNRNIRGNKRLTRKRTRKTNATFNRSNLNADMRLNAYTNMISQPSFQGELCKTFNLQGPTQILTTGLVPTIQAVYALGNVNTQIIDWTDYSNSYDQYLIERIKIRIICQTPPTPGTMRWFFDSSNNASLPVPADEARSGVLMTNHSMNANKIWTMTFVVTDPVLLAFRNTNVDYIVGYFKAITNQPQFGTTALGTALYQFSARYRVRFRGRHV